MKNIFFLLLAAPALVLAQGKQAIELQPFAPGETLHTGSVFYVNGKCGDSGVSIIVIQSDPKRGDSFLTDPLSEPNILVDNGVEKMAYDYALSDRNSVRCVNTKSGFKLVFAVSAQPPAVAMKSIFSSST